jgi:hypothetical protein
MSVLLGQLRRKNVLGLYRGLLRAGYAWPRWADTPTESTFGNFIIKRTMEQFRQNKQESDPKKIADDIAYAQQELDSLRRLLTDNSKHQVI